MHALDSCLHDTFKFFRSIFWKEDLHFEDLLCKMSESSPMNAGYQLCYGWLFSAIVLWFKWEHNFAYPCHQSVKTCEKAGIVLSCLLIKYWALGHTFDALNAIWHGNPRWQPNHYVSALCLQQPLTWIIELLHHKVTCSNFLVTWVCLSERRHILESGGCSHTVQLSKDGGLKNQ